MRRLAFRSKGEGSKGMVLVFYGLAMSVMLAFVALVVDVGYLYTQKAQKQFLADMTALTVLGTAGTVSGGRSATQQLAHINTQVPLQNAANDLVSNYWTISVKYSVETTSGVPDSRNITELKLNKPMVLDTFFLNLFQMPTVTVGLEAIAVRKCVQKTIDPGSSGNLHFFGCNLVELQGNVLLRSFNFTLNRAADLMVGGSNTRWHSQGNNYVGGEAFSAGRIDFTGGSVTWNGSYQTDTVSGGPGAGTYTHINQSYPEIVVPPAIGQATAAVNDNNLIGNANASSLASPNFILEPNDKKNPVVLPAGAKLYLRGLDIPGTGTVMFSGTLGTAGPGPVVITLDAQNAVPSKFIFFTDVDYVTASGAPMRPSYFKIIGINAPSSCVGQSEYPTIQFKHHTAYAIIYAPGFKVDIHSNPAFYGNIVADEIHMQGNPEIYADEENGFNFPTEEDPNECESLTRVHLIN